MAAAVAARTVVEDDREEIRFALALNGGVSLAVWMGGVVHELDRIRRGDGVYGELAEITQSTPRVDVIAGASAGGLNGALLALAIACDTPLEGVRDLWLAKGSFAELIRDPFDPDPPSLLRGDDYFLPTVRSAFEAIYARRRDVPDPQPLELIVTATTLSGDVRVFADAFGSLFPDRDHRARFVFRRDPDADRDDFASPDAPARLALAARTSSSFPAAFEPSYVPVGSGSEDRPDMAGVASFPVNRYAIDGGVLVNMPLQPVVQAILRQPARRQVRRVAAVVVPVPGSFDAPEPDDQAEIPAILGVAIASLSGIPRQQSIAEYFDQIDDHNRRTLERRTRRDELLLALDREALATLATQLARAYRRVRIADAAQYVVRRVVAGTSLPEAEALPVWDRDEVARAVRSITNPPWLPSDAQLAAFLADAQPLVAGGWPWGIGPVEKSAAVLLDIVRHTLLLAPLELAAEREELREARENAHRGLRALRALRQSERRLWEAAASGALAARDDSAALASWVKDTSARWREEVPETVLTDLSATFAEELRRVSDVVRTMFADGSPRLESIVKRLDAISPAGATTAQVQTNLLRFEFVERTLMLDEPGPDQPIELLQVSGNASNAFDARRSASVKLTGIQLEHFGAFYKSSWRANDWLWGRLDGIAQFVQVLLLPRRLRQLGYSTAEATALIEQAALGGVDASAAEVLGRYWNGEAVAAELAFLDSPTKTPPKSLAVSTEAIVRKLQLEVLRQELPTVARCVRTDVADGGERVPARRWAGRISETETLDAPKALELFVENEVGRESLAAEVGSDLFTRVATKILATASTAARGPHSGLVGPLRTAATAVRGVAIATYLLARGAVGGSRTGSVLLAWVMATAGAILAVQLLADSDPWAPLTTVATIVLIGGFLLALVRSARLALTILALVAAGIVGTIVLLFLGVLGDENDSAWERGLGWLRALGGVVFAIAAIVAIAIAFGLVRRPRWFNGIGAWKRELFGRAARPPFWVLWFLSRLPVLRRTLFYVRTDQQVLALSIDDGPDALVTPAVLDVLHEHSAKATFFLLGENAQRLPDLVRRIHDEGHEIANHTWKDERSARLSPEAFARSLGDTHEVLTRTDNVTLFRPGGGRLGNGRIVDQAADLFGYATVLASVYPQDLRISSQEVVVDDIVRRARRGAIVVLHDGRPERLRIVQILDDALPRLAAKGFTVTTVSELRALGT
jgi:patatin-related protein